MAQVQPIFQNPFEAFNPLKQLDHLLIHDSTPLHSGKK